MDAILVFSSSNPSTSSFNPRPTSGQRAAGSEYAHALREFVHLRSSLFHFCVAHFPNITSTRALSKTVIGPYLFLARIYPKTLVL